MQKYKKTYQLTYSKEENSNFSRDSIVIVANNPHNAFHIFADMLVEKWINKYPVAINYNKTMFDREIEIGNILYFDFIVTEIK